MPVQETFQSINDGIDFPGLCPLPPKTGGLLEGMAPDYNDCLDSLAKCVKGITTIFPGGGGIVK